ncbi:MAG TPA: POTRA domain-containing protein [Vicinamibacteria bacterium]|jgi:hypothetical protein
MRAIARSKARPWASAAAAAFLGLALAAPARGQAPEPAAPDEEAAAPLVERVEIARNQFLSAETLRFYISTKPGDRYDRLRLREDFRRLWDTGFVDDLSIDVRDSPRGPVLHRHRRPDLLEDGGGLRRALEPARASFTISLRRIDNFGDAALVHECEGQGRW